MYKLDIDSISIAEDQIDCYSPFRILIIETDEMNQMADRRQRAKGEKTFFDDSNPDNDYNGWYNFYFRTDGEEVMDFFYEDDCGNYIGDIEISEEDKQLAMQKIIEYYGGKKEYKRRCEEY